MPVPDLSDYVDLRFFDKDPQDVFDAALLDLQAKLPGWSPREGNIEVLLLEALAVQVAEAVFAANRIPEAVVMALLRLHRIEPDEGDQPTVSLRFVIADTLGHTIPADTSVRVDLPGGLEPIVFSTIADAVVPAGQSTAVVASRGDRFTSEGNGVAAGTRVDLIDSVTYVDRVELATTVTAGTDPETDAQWIARGVRRFARLSETLVLPRHFEAAVLEYPEVAKAKALDNFNQPLGTGSPGAHAGNISIAVYGPNGPVAPAVKTIIDDALEALVATNLQVHLFDPPITTVPVTADVRRTPGYDAATVVTNVKAALTAYLSPSTWQWGTTVRRTSLISLISNVDGVDYVNTLTAPGADVVLTSPAPLVTAGALTVTTFA